MLQRETVAPQLLDILDVLMKSKELGDLRLVGGTALALQLGHRMSDVIDLFGNHPYSSDEMDAIMSNLIKPDNQKGGAIIKAYYIHNVKVDVVKYQYPWLDTEIVVDGIRMASIKDIAAMKIGAITNRGSKKDFVELYVLLDQFSFDDIMSFYQKKMLDANIWLALHSVVYFDDAEDEPMPKLFIDVTWNQIKEKVIDVTLKYRNVSL